MVMRLTSVLLLVQTTLTAQFMSDRYAPHAGYPGHLHQHQPHRNSDTQEFYQHPRDLQGDVLPLFPVSPDTDQDTLDEDGLRSGEGPVNIMDLGLVRTVSGSAVKRSPAVYTNYWSKQALHNARNHNKRLSVKVFRPARATFSAWGGK